MVADSSTGSTRRSAGDKQVTIKDYKDGHDYDLLKYVLRGLVDVPREELFKLNTHSTRSN